MHGETYALTLLATAKWITDLGVMWLTGVCVFRGVFERRAFGFGSGSAVDCQLARHAGLALVVLVVGTLARLYAQTYSSFGLDEPVTGELLRLVAEQTRWGGRWVAQGAAVIVAAVMAALVQARCRSSWWLLAAATLVVVATMPMTGHAFAYVDGVLWPMVLQVGHLCAAGAWIGSLFMLLMVGLRQARLASAGEEDIGGGALISAIADRFSPVALTAAGTLAATGLLTAILYVEESSQLWRTSYGRLLLVKTGLFGVTAMLGAYNWRKVRPLLTRPGGVRRFRYSATAELLAAAAVLAVTAWLVHLPMPHE